MFIRFCEIDPFLSKISKASLEPAILLLALLIMVAQGYELSTRSEVISLATCLGVLALASFALNWARVPAELCSLALREQAYCAGLDALRGSLLFVVAIGWAWFSAYVPSPVYPALFVIHLLFVVLAVLTSCSASIRIIRCLQQADIQSSDDL